MGEAGPPADIDLPGPVVAVVGPTATGKSDLAESLAERFRGEIVSADSMQVYRGLDIGTAKPPVTERRVRYHCVDIADPGGAYSAALFQRDARAAIDDILARGSVPVVVGGTGLYVRAALDQMSFPAGDGTSPERSRLETLLAEEGADALHARLAAVDPAAAAAVHPHNARRVVRALEMREIAGASYAQQAAGFSVRTPAYACVYLGLTLERSRLYERIDARVDRMIEAGLLDEVRGLVEAGHRAALVRTGAIGYKELVDVVESRASLPEAVAAIKQASRRYAKRQMTWFRADPRIEWIDVTDLSPVAAAGRASALVESMLGTP